MSNLGTRGTFCRVALARGSCARVVHAPRHMTLNLVTSWILLCLPSPPNVARVFALQELERAWLPPLRVNNRDS
jgi:hypothetical protein